MDEVNKKGAYKVIGVVYVVKKKPYILGYHLQDDVTGVDRYVLKEEGIRLGHDGQMVNALVRVRRNRSVKEDKEFISERLHPKKGEKMFEHYFTQVGGGDIEKAMENLM